MWWYRAPGTSTRSPGCSPWRSTAASTRNSWSSSGESSSPSAACSSATAATAVAHAAAFTRELTVPGASVPAAHVTMVGVAPTHRRRGLLTGLMRRQLREIRDAGREPIAVLWASEGRIYPRFGYGLAAQRLTSSSTPPRLRLPAPAPAAGTAPPGPAGRATGRAGRGVRPGARRASRLVEPRRTLVAVRARRRAAPAGRRHRARGCCCTRGRRGSTGTRCGGPRASGTTAARAARCASTRWWPPTRRRTWRCGGSCSRST